MNDQAEIVFYNGDTVTEGTPGVYHASSAEGGMPKLHSSSRSIFVLCASLSWSLVAVHGSCGSCHTAVTVEGHGHSGVVEPVQAVTFAIMQGFNKYYPPDYDGEKHKSLNSYRGKHALGNRAHKIDQGILVTRFELPFNIWCGTCNNHIGMGVRYNAEKKKIGNYYSTPIFSFRCKCHLCDGHFEIHTDPKNTRYIVASGARKKDEDWNPAENGGFAIHDTEGKAAAQDPLATLEKTTEAQHNLTKVQIPRLEALQELSDQYNADPYSLSVKARKRFRENKKLDIAKRKIEDEFKERYGLSEALSLAPDDDERAIRAAKQEWDRGRQELDVRERNKRRRLDVEITSIPSSSKSKSSANSKSVPLTSLRTRILENTARKSNPFDRPISVVPK